MKKVFSIFLILFQLGCGLDLVLSQGSAANQKKEEVRKAEIQAQKMVEKLKDAEEKRKEEVRKALEQQD